MEGTPVWWSQGDFVSTAELYTKPNSCSGLLSFLFFTFWFSRGLPHMRYWKWRQWALSFAVSAQGGQDPASLCLLSLVTLLGILLVAPLHTACGFLCLCHTSAWHVVLLLTLYCRCMVLLFFPSDGVCCPSRRSSAYKVRGGVNSEDRSNESHITN